MSEVKVSAVKDWAKRMGVRLGEMVLLSVVADKVTPTAKTIGAKVMDKLAALQGRKNAEELDELVKKTEEKQKAEATPPAAPAPPPLPPPPTPTTTSAAASTDAPVEAKFGDA